VLYQSDTPCFKTNNYSPEIHIQIRISLIFKKSVARHLKLSLVSSFLEVDRKINPLGHINDIIYSNEDVFLCKLGLLNRTRVFNRASCLAGK
jgi:hypothetical protein